MNLLLVDDQISVLDGLLHGIDYDSLGYSHVFSATNACDAIAICEKEDIHVLVTDIEMPGKSGLEQMCIRDSPVTDRQSMAASHVSTSNNRNILHNNPLSDSQVT